MHGSFLSAADRADLVKIARDGLEEHRIARRANAVLLLDKGWSFAEVAEAFYIDDSTVRAWLKAFQDGGVEALVLFDLNGGACALSPLQIDELRAWATETLPTSTTEIGQFILERFGLDYTRSGLIKLMNASASTGRSRNACWQVRRGNQQKCIDAHEDLRNSLGPDEAVVYVDAVHPTHQSKPAGRWLPRGQRCALQRRPDATAEPARRDRPGDRTDRSWTWKRRCAKRDALFEALEQTRSTMSRIHVFFDNARYHHAKVVRAGCSGQEGASSCTSCRPIALISTGSSGCGR